MTQPERPWTMLERWADDDAYYTAEYAKLKEKQRAEAESGAQAGAAPDVDEDSPPQPR